MTPHAASRGRERLSAADQAWFRMDAADNPMVITALQTFSDRLPRGHLEAFVEERLLAQERFRQRLVPGGSLRAARWERDPDFDLRGHVHHVALPRPGDDAELGAMIGDLMSRPLDPRRPLWHLTLVDDYQGGSAVIVQIHHSVADGVALMHLLTLITGGPPTGPKTMAHELRAWSGGPLARSGRAAAAVARLLLLPADPRTTLKGTLGPTKRVAWSSPIALSTFKELARRRDAKVNDVFASLVAGGLRRYLRAVGPVSSDLEVRAVVPVDLRDSDEDGALGNRFGLAFLGLPLGISTAEERLREIVRRTHALKGGDEALVTFAMLQGMGRAGAAIDDLVVGVFQTKATLVLTSVPGPPTPVSVAGHPLRSMVFWAPQAGRLGLGVSLLSYAGELRVGVASDAKVVARPGDVVGGIEAELGELSR